MSAKTKILRTWAKRPDAIAAGLGRFLTTEHTEHTEKNPCTVMPCFRVFDLFRGSPVFDNKTEQVVAAPASHAGFRSLKITSFWARRMPSIAVSVEALDWQHCLSSASSAGGYCSRAIRATSSSNLHPTRRKSRSSDVQGGRLKR